eukprot:7384341-Prymnesium_polylepis.1
MRELGALLTPAAAQLDLHDAAQASWAWSSLARDLRTDGDWAPEEWTAADEALSLPPRPLLARASALPFAVHLGVCEDALGAPPDASLDALLHECRPRRDTIASGSAVSCAARAARRLAARVPICARVACARSCSRCGHVTCAPWARPGAGSTPRPSSPRSG